MSYNAAADERDMRERYDEWRREQRRKRDGETGRRRGGDTTHREMEKNENHTQRVTLVTSSQRNWSIVSNTTYKMHNFCELLFQP